LNETALNETQSVGDLIGRAARLYRANLTTWFPILLWPTVLSALGRAMFQGGISGIADMSFSATALALLAVGVIGAILTLVAKWVLLVRQLSFVRLATGFSDSLSESLAFVKQRQWSIAGAVAIMYFMLLAVFGLAILEVAAASLIFRPDTFLVIPSVVGVIGGLIGGTITLMFIYFAAFVVLSAIACQANSVTGLVSSGFRLAGKQLMRTVYMGNMVCLTILLLSIPFWLPMMALIGIDYVRLGQDAFANGDLPIHWSVLLTSYESLVDVVVWPVAFVSYGLYYYDLRLRQEGVDMLLDIDRLERARDSKAS